MKVILVGMGRYLSLFGVRILSSFLNSKGHPTSICFIPVANYQSLYQQECQDFAEFIAEQKPDIVGFSLMFCDSLRAKRLTRAMKNRCDIPVIWGGLHPGLCPDDVPEEVDYISTGDGEIPFLALLTAMETNTPTDSIPGIWKRNDQGWNKTPTGHRWENLDDLPFPDHRKDAHFILHHGKYQVLTDEIQRQYLVHAAHVHSILTTRGCPYTCTYCANSAIAGLSDGSYVRRRSPENIIAELEEVLARFPYILAIVIADDLFTAAPEEWQIAFCDAYKRKIKLPFFCEIHPNYVDRKSIRRLIDAGMSGVGMGIQSGSQRILMDLFKRGTPPEKIKKTVQILDEEGKDINRFYDIIVDNPFQTEDEIVETVLFVNEFTRNFNLSIFPLLFYPGTEMTDQAKNCGFDTNQPKLLSGESCKYEPSYLNRLLRCLPYTPAKWITYWVKGRNKPGKRRLFYLYYFGYFTTFHKFLYNIRKVTVLWFSLHCIGPREQKAKRIMRYIKL